MYIIYFVNFVDRFVKHGVGPEGSRGFGPFHLKPKAHAEEEEVLGDK